MGALFSGQETTERWTGFGQHYGSPFSNLHANAISLQKPGGDSEGDS